MKTTTTVRPVLTRFIDVELDEHEARVVYDLLQGFINPESLAPAGTFEQFVADLEQALTAPIQEPEPIKEPVSPGYGLPPHSVLLAGMAPTPPATRKQVKRPPEPCPACGTSISAGGIARHYATRHPGVALPGDYSCPEAGCTYRGASMSAVHMHRWRTHGLKAADMDQTAEPEAQPDPEPEPVSFVAIDAPVTVAPDELLSALRGWDVLPCRCGRKYATAGSLQAHIERDHDGVEPDELEVQPQPIQPVEPTHPGGRSWNDERPVIAFRGSRL